MGASVCRCPRRAGALLGGALLWLALPALAAPKVSSELVLRYPFEDRVPGDGAPIVHVPDDVPEPLFLSATRERLTVWWRIRHVCDQRPVPQVTLDKRRLVLEVSTKSTPATCSRAASIFETVIEPPSLGPWELVSRPGAPPLASLWLTVPSPPLPKELPILTDRVRERGPLRELGERIAWRYYEERQSKATLTAYRWLMSLDELHWRNALYQARVFESQAFTRSKGSAIASMEALVPAVERLRRAAKEPASSPEEQALRARMQAELEGLEAFLEPALRWLGMRWHSEAAHRWHGAAKAYAAYLELFPGAAHAPLVRFLYGSALLQIDDGLAAREQFRLAREGLEDPERQALAAACATLLGVEGTSWEQLAPCRAQRPTKPAFKDFPGVKDARFARPRAMEE
jgi:hypothetical protein